MVLCSEECILLYSPLYKLLALCKEYIVQLMLIRVHPIELSLQFVVPFMVITNEEMTSSLSYLSVLALILDEMAPLCIHNEANNRPFVQASIPLTCVWIAHPPTSPFMDHIQTKWLCRGGSQLYYHWKNITLLISDQVKNYLSVYWACNFLVMI